MATIDTVMILVGPEHDDQYRALVGGSGKSWATFPGAGVSGSRIPIMTPTMRMRPGQAWRAALQQVPVSKAVGHQRTDGWRLSAQAGCARPGR